jgi:thiamine biosynthesis lipoprotein
VTVPLLDLPWTAPGAPTGARIRSSRPMMGTIVTVEVEASLGEAALEEAFGVMDAWCEVASEWDDSSVVSRINRAPVGVEVPCPPRLLALLGLSERVHEASGGAFDPTWLALRDLWSGSGPPPEGAAAARRACVGLPSLRQSPTGVTRTLEGVTLGLGAIAKGTAVDLAIEALEARGARTALVDAGGDLRWFVGPGEAGRSVDIVDPRERRAVLDMLQLTMGAAATSGHYEQAERLGGRPVSHIVDPRTGEPALGLLGATVVAPTAEEADALSTAVMVLGAGAWEALIEGWSGAEALVVDAHGSVHASTGWSRLRGVRGPGFAEARGDDASR